MSVTVHCLLELTLKVSNLDRSSVGTKYIMCCSWSIFSCMWDQKPCSPDSFVMYITDHGLCYTFNSGKNGSGPLLAATQTGTQFSSSNIY